MIWEFLDYLISISIVIDITTMAALLIILITGYFIYKIITSPIKTFRFIIKGTLIFVLGCAAWFAIACLLMYNL